MAALAAAASASASASAAPTSTAAAAVLAVVVLVPVRAALPSVPRTSADTTTVGGGLVVALSADTAGCGRRAVAAKVPVPRQTARVRGASEEREERRRVS